MESETRDETNGKKTSPYPQNRTPDGRIIPSDEAQHAVLTEGALLVPGDFRYCSLGDLALMAMHPAGIFASAEIATMRLASIELRALAIALNGPPEAVNPPGTMIDTEISTEEAMLMLDGIARRLDAATELCIRMRNAGRDLDHDQFVEHRQMLAARREASS